MTFKFLRGPIRPTPAYPFDEIDRPEIPIWIGVGDGPRSPFYALLDTGADDTKIPLAQADRLGLALDRDHPVVFRGVGGITIGYFGEVTMELRQSPKSYVWSAKVSFIPDMSDVPMDKITISLGHTGFFRFFNADFDFLRGRVELKPNRLFVGRRR